MSKDDTPPLPDRVPAKRRQIGALLDVHIAMWLASDKLTPSERRRLGEEKARRKALVPERSVGLLVGREGVTPTQGAKLLRLLRDADPTVIHHPGVSGPLHSACRGVADVEAHRDVRSDDNALRAVVKQATHLVIGAPKENRPAQSPVWDAVRYAKHRSIAVKVVLPDGGIYNESAGT